MKRHLYGKVANGEILTMQNFDEGNEPEGYLKIKNINNSVIPKGFGSRAMFKIVGEENGFVLYEAVFVPNSPSEVLEIKLKDGFTYKNNTYQLDEKSRLNITGKALRLQLDDADSITQWRTMDNQMVPFTKAEFIEFAKAVSDYYEQCFMESLAAMQ